MENQYSYSHRAVAFLDVLGFQNKLKEFEEESIDFQQNQHGAEHEEPDGDIEEEDLEGEDNGSTNDDTVGGIYYSKKASDFIETFNRAISKLDSDKFSYYLFSDNICITAKVVDERGEKTLVELLLVIAELYYEFVQRGYFLRGGVDYGLFIDKASIALGVPLANAYKMESTQAVFPRIILSKTFIKQLEVYSNDGELEPATAFTDSLIKKSCEIQYLNVFNHIFKVESKEAFFESYSSNISENLNSNKLSENIFLKYKWLADEFNSFIELYTSNLAYLDEDFEVSEDFLEAVNTLKISYGQ